MYSHRVRSIVEMHARNFRRAAAEIKDIIEDEDVFDPAYSQIQDIILAMGANIALMESQVAAEKIPLKRSCDESSSVV